MPASLPPPGTRDVLYIIDLSGYVFRAYHAIRPLSSPKGEPTHATFGTISMLQRLISERKPEKLAVAMDSRIPSFRKQIDPGYKANRPPPPPDLSLQMERCREIISAYGIPIWQRDGFEADDLIASAVRHAQAHSLRVVIVSADKDLMQLVTDRVLMWDTTRNKVYGPAEVQDKLGVPPGRVRDLLALTGDTSDNISGVKSIGPKTATDLLSQFSSIDEMLENLDKVQSKRFRAAVEEHRDALLLSRRLVSLRDDLLDDIDLEALRCGNPDTERLRLLFAELGFTRLVESLSAGEPAGRFESGMGVQYETILDLRRLQDMLESCRASKRFAIDTETTSTDAMRASLVGISLSFRAGEAFYIPLAHRYIGAPVQLGLDDVRAALAPLLSSPNVLKAGQHLKFDEIVLRRHGFGPLRGVEVDTMIASYLLDPEASHGLKELAKRELGIEMTSYEAVTERAKGKQLGFDEVAVEAATQYAAADADMTLRLADKLVPELEQEGLRELLRDVEIPLSSVLVDIEMTGVLVDTDRLAALGGRIDEQIRALEAIAKKQVGHDFNVNSPRQLETILFDELKLPVVKRTKTARSTDASVLEALSEHHPLAETILEQRQLAKLRNTYIDTLPKLVHPETGRIHTSFNQTVAATGRLSSSDPNLQNIPVRTEIGKAIREAFIAAPGYVLVSADYSQIELRVLAHLARDPVLIDAFRKGEDVHTRTAMEVFGVSADDVTSEMRRRAKTINFGVMYGMGEVALAKRLSLSRDEAAGFIDAYFTRYESIRVFMEQTVQNARAGEAVRTLLGRHRLLRDLGSANRQLRAQAERVAGNTPIQGSAADILKLAMIKLASPVVPNARMILTVHDELVFEIPDDQVDRAKERIRTAMENVVQLEVPLTVDIGVGRNWAEAH